MWAPTTTNSKLAFIRLDPLPDCHRHEGGGDRVSLDFSLQDFPCHVSKSTKPLGEKFSNQQAANPNTTRPWQSQLEMLDGGGLFNKTEFIYPADSDRRGSHLPNGVLCFVE